VTDTLSSAKQFLKDEKKQTGKQLSYAISIGTFSGVLLIIQAWCLATVINGVIFQDKTLNDMMSWMWVILVLILFRAVLAYFSELLAFSAAADIKRSLRERLYQKLHALGPVYLSSERSGELSTVMMESVEAIEAYYARYLPAMSLAALIPLSILVFVFPLDWQSALVMLVTAPLIPFFMILIGKGAERMNQKQWQQLQRMGGHFFDAIRGLTTLKLFNATEREARLITRISENYRIATMKVLRIAFLSALALEFFATVSIAIVAVLIGFRLLFAELDFMTGFFVLLLAPEFYLPLRNLGTHYHSRMNAIAAVEKIVAILDQKPLHRVQPGGQHLSTASVSIEFSQVSFAYHVKKPILKDITLSIQPGEKIAIVGPSGAGKTTLSQLLMGFIKPDSGSISINGVNLNEIDIESWHQSMAWVPQRPTLFYGSVLENLTMGLNNVTQAEVQHALENANALDFIEQLPEGLNTLIGEGGRALSGGQIQRLVLARTFLRRAAVVILDEATANLDTHTEQQIQQSISKLAETATMIIIAHRLQTVKDADRILVLEQGRLVQLGSHEQLMHEKGLYQQLIAAHGGAA
jgi:ATP-binding cassette subfamily C protein CydD